MDLVNVHRFHSPRTSYGFSFLGSWVFSLLVEREREFCVACCEPRHLIAGPRRGPNPVNREDTMAQLPAGAEGAAAGVLVWSSTCLLANILLLWLLWTGHERRSCQFFHFMPSIQRTKKFKISICRSSVNLQNRQMYSLSLVSPYWRRHQVSSSRFTTSCKSLNHPPPVMYFLAYNLLPDITKI